MTKPTGFAEFFVCARYVPALCTQCCFSKAHALLEAGFEQVTGEYVDGGKLFRKRKIDDNAECGSTLPNNVERAGSSVV